MIASSERISGESIVATADWAVIYHFTIGIKSAGARTWIYTLLTETSLIQRTFGAYCTFWSATRRATDVIGKARANGLPVNLATLAVGSTGRWLARIPNLLFT